MASATFRWLSRVPRWVWWVTGTCLLSLSVGIYLGDVFRTPVRHVMFNVFGVGAPAEVPPKLGAVAKTGPAAAARPGAPSGQPAPEKSGSGLETSTADASAPTPATPGPAAPAAPTVAPADPAPPAPPLLPMPPTAAEAVVPPEAVPPVALQAPPVDPAEVEHGAAVAAAPPTQAPVAAPALDTASPGTAPPTWSTQTAAQGVQDYLALPVTVRVKVFVDELYARAHPDWLTRAQRTLALASSALRLSARIELELIGVVRFAEPLDGLSLPSLLSTLKHRARDGADVALAFVDHEVSADACTGGDVTSAHNGNLGVVGPDLMQGYLSGTLRCLGLLMGAQLIDDEDSQAYRLGSFMRPDQNISGQHPPWLDPENRARIMQRKGLPFGPSPVAAGAEEVAP